MECDARKKSPMNHPNSVSSTIQTKKDFSPLEVQARETETMTVVNPKSRQTKNRWKIVATTFVGFTLAILLLLRSGGDRQETVSSEAGIRSSSNVQTHNIRSSSNNNSKHDPSSSLTIPSIRLATPGLDMPAIGYGTCCRASAKGEAIYESTKVFLGLGGTLIDTAMAYKNHAEIGRAVRDSGIDRSRLWITSKISPGKVRSYEDCLTAIENILKELETPYLDLLLIHSPKLGRKLTVELWKALIEAQRQGKTKAIGVSNFNRGEVEDIAHATNVWPAANEIQQHPWSSRAWKELAAWQHEKGIATIAYTSLGGQRNHKAAAGGGGGASAWPEAVAGLARHHGATEAQILLKWALQSGLAVIPGSGNPDHIRENLVLPPFELSKQDLADIEASPPPNAWFDPKRGPNKYGDAEASAPWQ